MLNRLRNFTRNRPQPDMLLVDQDHFPIAAIDVINLEGWTPEEAIEQRKLWSEIGYKPRTPYVFIVSQKIGCLWRMPEQADPSSYPAYVLPMETIMQRYGDCQPGVRISAFVVERLVENWLEDLTKGKSKIGGEPDNTLAQIGFIEAIKGAEIYLEDAL